jgi:arylsulfatase A-like enzyme
VRPPDSLSTFRGSKGKIVITEKEPASDPPRLSVNSWLPRRTATKRAAGQSALRDLIKSYASWVILLALSIDGLALLIEPALLLVRNTPPRAVVADYMATLGLSAIFSMAAAIPIAAVYSLACFLVKLQRPWRFAWPVPLVALAGAVVLEVAPHPVAGVQWRFAAQAVLFAFLAFVLLVATAVRRLGNAWRLALCGLLVGALFGMTFIIPTTIHQEPHDIIWLCMVVLAVAALYPIRRMLRAATHERVSGTIALLCVVSTVGLLAGKVSPNWRVYARDRGRFAERMSRFCRTFIDLDADGFSAVLGGMDCDDWEPRRNPICGEMVDGHDRNCNGHVRTAEPTAAQRGLVSGVGDPDLAPGAVDRVVLITVDCLRSDALLPDVTPNVLHFADRGLRFTKLYAGGARTTTSLPLVMRGSYGAPPVAARLGASGVTSTAIFAYRHSSIESNIFEGFDDVKRPDDGNRRFRASEMTDFALEDLRRPEHRRGHFLWIHYFDAHGPRARRVLPTDTPRFRPMQGEDADSSLYLSELAYDDREIGRLLAGVEATGDPGKTVVIVTGDHGEAFGAHWEYEHGQSPYEEVVHVPGVLVGPGVPQGIHSHVVSLRDIAATILGAFGLVGSTPDIEDKGLSWMRLRGAPQARLHTFAITYSTSAHVLEWSEAPMVIRTDDETKLAVSYSEGIVRFYRIDSPEGEFVDVAPEYPTEVARARFELEDYRDIDPAP